jgi:mannose-6-phosphate isomerase-like protein (cupin superfamily)
LRTIIRASALEKIWTVFDTGVTPSRSIQPALHTSQSRESAAGAWPRQSGGIMKALSVAGALGLLVLTGAPSLAIDYGSPFDPVVALGGETPIIYPNFPVELLVTEAQSGGQFGMVVSYHKPGEGPEDNLLLETKLTEVYYVLEGRFEFSVGEDLYEGGPGTVVMNPPKMPHGFKSVGTGIGKLLTITTPMESGHGTEFFTLWAEQSTRSPEWIAKKNAEYGIDRPAR